jgi:biotin carboxyl carrier protein
MDKSFIINNETVKVKKVEKSSHEIGFELNGKIYQYKLKSMHNDQITLDSNGRSIHALISETQILYNDECIKISNVPQLKRSKKGQFGAGNAMVSPMPGKIFKINVELGSEVKQGDVLIILEAMKMEHAVKASINGIVKEIYFKEGELVDGGVTLASIDKFDQDSN